MPKHFCPACSDGSPPLPGLEHCETHYVKFVIEPMNREMANAREIILRVSSMKQAALDKLLAAKRAAQSTHTYGRWGEESKVGPRPTPRVRCGYCGREWVGTQAGIELGKHVCAGSPADLAAWRRLYPDADPPASLLNQPRSKSSDKPKAKRSPTRPEKQYEI